MNSSSAEPRPPAAPLAYRPQLDAIRAFAVTLVLWHHWCGPEDWMLGPIGVWIFFVLSGFLITRILLTSRQDTSRGNRRALRTFYIRRFLRIFPLYYFVLLLGFATSETFRASWPWYVTYLQNFWMMALAESDGPIFGGHLWTLAVEEQFYVVWPLIALFAPRRLIAPAIACAIGVAIVSRCICAARGWTPFQAYAFTVNNLDTLGLGALLAYVVTYRPDRVARLRNAAIVALVAIAITGPLLRNALFNAAVMQLPTGLIALWVISYAAEGVRGWVGWAMSFPPSVYIGRISYGIYIYHLFVPDVLKPVLRRFHIEEGSVAFVLACFVVTIGVASLSWFLLEKPFNRLKDRYARSGL